MRGGDDINNDEIALQLTLKAMEHDKVALKPSNFTNDNTLEDVRKFIAKQLHEFYKDILEYLNTFV